MKLDSIIQEKEYPGYKRYFQSAFEAQQHHIFRWWSEIGAEEKKHLLEQISTIDFQFIQKLFHENTQQIAAPIRGNISPPQIINIPHSSFEKKLAHEARLRGEASLRKGEIAVLTVAGGQGTRLGGNRPKGTLPIAPITHKSIFQLHAEKIHATQQKYRTGIPWFIMTSETNDFVTQTFFQSHQFFGLDPKQICFFSQKMLPVVDLNGKLLMDSQSSIVMSPNGHGGTIIALKEKGILNDMKRRGIKNIFYHQVDNVLIKIADPVFIGYHVKGNAEMSLKIVIKGQPEEKVGIIVSLNGHLHMIEYSELSHEDRYARNENGALKYNAGNIAVHMINIDFLESVYQKDDSLPYHAAFKKVPYIDEHGNTINPRRNNAIKFESFIFDILKYVDRGVIMEVLRDEEFSPVKNTDGADSPVTAKRDMINLFGRWLRKAGISIPVDTHGNVVGSIEISPLFALDEEEVSRKVDRHAQYTGFLNLYVNPP